jgi:hypothetical protein
MRLSFLVEPLMKGKTRHMRRRVIKAKITTDHSASSYGQPVIVLQDGSALDLMSWVGCGYRVVEATCQEREYLVGMGLL